MTDVTASNETSGEVLSPIDSVRMTLPQQWVQVTANRDLIDRLFEETLTNIEAEGIALPKPDIRRLEASFGQMRRYMLDRGIASLALFADVFRKELEGQEVDDAKDPQGEPFLASATMAIVHLDKERLGTDISLSPKSLALILSRTRPNEPEERPVHRFTSLEPPAMIDHPAGPAVVLKQVLEYRPSVVESTKLFTQSYFISPPEHEGKQITLVQFASPNVELARSFSRLFEAIANTFVFLREGDESVPFQ